MKIEVLFLQKAIKDKNYISFFYLKKEYKNIEALFIEKNILKTKDNSFKLDDIKKLTIQKERF